ncbi:hypothetical protein BS50DRAFT_493135, partial [Corynespora cassiicola Philippines]
IFKNLPREVYDCIVEQLEQLHFAQQNEACSSCYLKDLYNLALTSRAWDQAATAQMYRKVFLLCNDEHSRMPKLRIPGTSRLKLLRRSLRERPALARYVRELHVSDFQSMYQTASIEREDIVNLVASLVMACPNLERLVGFHIPYTHSHDRLSYALSTRPKLKERVWLLAEKSDMDPDEDEDEPTSAYYHAACDPMERFLELNADHAGLSTLVLHQESSRPSIPMSFRAIIGTLRQFPMLCHLSLSGLPATSFTNLALNALPPNLLSLRLENLPGINDKGLQRFFQSPTATTIQKLTLINLEVSSLVTLAAILSPSLPALSHFTISQHKAPILSSGQSIDPFASSTLTYIHWEFRSQAGPPPTLLSTKEPPTFPFTSPEPISSLATHMLATSIKASLLTSLTRIRAPHDPKGVLQSLCRPLASALLPSDYALLTSPPRPASVATLRSQDIDALIDADMLPRADSAMGGSLASDSASATAEGGEQQQYSPALMPLLQSLTPTRSRLAAQARIQAARRDPAFRIRVFDPRDVLRVERRVGGFVGEVGSRVTYEVRPDRARVGGAVASCEGQWEGGEWVLGIGDVVGEWEVVGRRGRACGHFGGRAGGEGVRGLF